MAERQHQEQVAQDSPHKISIDMQLREFINLFDQEEENRYNPLTDISIKELDDTRKVKLTLKTINELRHAQESKMAEHKKEAAFLKQMYGAAPEADLGL